MAQHLPFSAFDMTGIEQAVRRYETAGLNPEFDDGQLRQGIVSIRFDNPVRSTDYLWVYFEIHKLAKKQWLRTKAHWIVQLYSQGAQAEPHKRGCVSASSLAHVMYAAETDLNHGLVSVCPFDLAVSAMEES